MAEYIASRRYNPGDLIHSENAFARVLSRNLKNEYCEFCLQRLTTLKSCKQCLSVWYCKKSCQKADWPDHRLECKYLKNLPECADKDMVRLMGKVILKIKGKDWKTITTNVLGTEVSFDDIDSCEKKTTENPLTMLKYEERKEGLRRYIGDENMPKEDDLIKIFGKVINHVIIAFSSSDDLLTCCFFLGICSFDRECIPNSNWQVARQKTLKIWAIRNIIKGKEKITVSFNPVLSPTSGTSLPECKCTDCSLPYGKSVLTKITDEKKAYSVIKSTERFLGMIEHGPMVHMLPGLSDIVDIVLEEHVGVLADTNILHLKVLAMGLTVGGSLSDLMKLEKIMRSIFGEYYLEMVPIYETLMQLNMQLGNFTEGSIYLQKLKKLHMHDTD